MTNPFELNAARVVRMLHADHEIRHEESSLTIGPGAYFSWDAEGGDVTLQVRPELGLMFHLSASVRRAPRWLSFCLELREGSFAAGDILGLVLELEGCAGHTLPLFIRSARDGGVLDTYLQEPLVGTSTVSVQTLLHPIRADQAMADGPAFHTLVVPLPMRDFSLELRDLRLFVLPADRQFALSPATTVSPVPASVPAPVSAA